LAWRAASWIASVVSFLFTTSRIRSLPLSIAIVSDLLPRLARILPSSGVTVAARTELKLTRVSSKRS
tara:strand:+ start:1339 stop:1539 length:201 start_codon:yes stop_codon:yes gene_type:complete